MKLNRPGTLLFLLIFCAFLTAVPNEVQSAKPKKNDPKRWESAIKKFELQDKKSPSPKNAILFVGSSSIRKWDLKQAFPKLKTINRGFGGSQIEDSNYFFDRLASKHRPRIIIMYAGENDLTKGKSAIQVLEDYKKFAAEVHRKLPHTEIIFIGIKASVKHWAKVEKIKQFNLAVKKQIDTDPQAAYVDVFFSMLGKDGKPRVELLHKDKLHLSEKGYSLWNKQMKKAIYQAEQRYLKSLKAKNK